ncbi:DUF4270 family protein [Tunicatimonas pelagia]|uniref:DUF4270 family protein n=1 Tax=Tunicatimonas pelagia TaxID=931531 RepID=UPI002666E53F|nr:DUF4270 family protein [Tunicatimonas pelagia]WKN42744.1 DUF4270 family protein [Tunicatimonas pelagia]
MRIAIILICTFVLLFASCEYSDSIGLDFVEEAQFDAVFLDTATVSVSTVLFDSLYTSSTGRLLSGYHTGETFGSIAAQAFFQVGLDSLSVYPDEDHATYDRFTLVLEYDDYAYYDTTQLQTFYLYSVTEDIAYREDGNLYNTSGFAYDTINPIGMISQYIRPHRAGGSIEMSVSDVLGQALFTLAQQQADVLSSESDFLGQYPGFVLVPDLANTAIVGFSNSSHLKLYYQQGGEEQEIVFPIDDHIYFTQLLHDRGQTAFTLLQEQRYELSAGETGHQAFLQGGVGTAIRIEFPYLKSLLALGNGVYVTEAFLKLNPIQDTFDESTPLPTNLSVYRVDGLNRIVSTYDSAFTLYIDQEFKEDTYYSLPVSGFLNDQLSTNVDNENALLIVLPEEFYHATVDRMVVGGALSEEPTLLELFLLKNFRRQ